MTGRSIPAREVHESAMQDPEYARVYNRTWLANQVATQVVRYRADHGLSRAELARQLRVHGDVVERLEAGQETILVQLSENGLWCQVQLLRGCFAAGPDVAEFLAALADAVEMCLEPARKAN
jgi:hypothetical protein